MDLLPILMFAVILVIAFILITSSRKQPKTAEGSTFTYETRGRLFSPAERSFLGVLEQCIGENYAVYGKVRLADVIKAKASNRSEWQRAFNTISSKHVDFVLCAKGDTLILAVIELDDKSHAKKARQVRDDFLNKALAAAAIPLVRMPAKSAYTLQEVKQRLALETLSP